MSRTVNGERLFGDREKEVLRKMLWQVADFSGVELLTYAVMGNHFHVLIRVPDRVEVEAVSDRELLRRWRVLYPKPTKYETATAMAMERMLALGGEEAEKVRTGLLARMGDVSAFMKTLKQRFTIWFNKSHERYGPLWSDRFKSVLVEGRGNALQTMAVYIDLNPVRAGLVKDPKDYRFCGYGEAVAGLTASGRRAREGLRIVWAAYADGSVRRVAGGDLRRAAVMNALQQHRSCIFAKGAERGSDAERAAMLKVLEKEDGLLPMGAALRCRVRYFTDGAVLGSADFVRSHVRVWKEEKERRRPPKVNPMLGADWGDLAVIRGLRRRVFS
jgi:REP element-mobilizing transposase RayT